MVASYDLSDRLSDKGEKFFIRNHSFATAARACRLAFARVEKHQVDIGSVVEFAASEFAEGDYGHLSRNDAAPLVAGKRRAVTIDRFLMSERKRIAEYHIGEAGKFQGHFGERRRVKTVAQVDSQQLAIFESGQPRSRIEIDERDESGQFFGQLLTGFVATEVSLSLKPIDIFRMAKKAFGEKGAMGGKGEQSGKQHRVAACVDARAFQPFEKDACAARIGQRVYKGCYVIRLDFRHQNDTLTFQWALQPRAGNKKA
jgi:hypothetical protein